MARSTGPGSTPRKQPGRRPNRSTPPSQPAQRPQPAQPAQPSQPSPGPAPQPQGAPDTGPGSVAGFGPRFVAFIIDGILADVLALIINGGPHADARQSLSSYIAFLLIELVFVTYAGQTPGMRMAGLAVSTLDRTRRPPLHWVLLRTLLIATIVPALITDSSGRGMHDRAAGTVMFHVR